MTNQRQERVSDGLESRNLFHTRVRSYNQAMFCYVDSVSVALTSRTFMRILMRIELNYVMEDSMRILVLTILYTTISSVLSQKCSDVVRSSIIFFSVIFLWVVSNLNLSLSLCVVFKTEDLDHFGRRKNKQLELSYITSIITCPWHVVFI